MWSKDRVTLTECSSCQEILGLGREWREKKIKMSFLSRDLISDVVSTRMSILIICILITGLGIIFIISHLSRGRRSQRTRGGKQPGVGGWGGEVKEYVSHE